MGTIVVCTMLSVDGYAEGPGGDVMAMPMDAAFAAYTIKLVNLSPLSLAS